MMDVPRAHVEGSRPPLHQRPGVRKLATVVAVVAACFGGWKLFKWATRSDANKQLEARQDIARATIGGGLDRLFEAQLDEDTKTVELVATFDVDAQLDARYEPHDCAKGLQEAFAEALGPNVVEVSTYTTESHRDLRLELTGKITPNGHHFRLPNSRAEYPGIALAADLKLVGKTVHAEVEPAADIEFEYQRFTFSTDGASPSDVAGGILQSTCKQAGYVLLEQLTKWKRPPPPPPSDPIKDCERGFHCVENADALADRDPMTAEKLYAQACQHDDEEACARLAELVLDAPAATDHALARVTLDIACSQDIVPACHGGARVALIPAERGKPPGDWQRRDALVLALRACDLGARDACTLAASLVENTPYAEAAPLLAGDAKTVASKRMGMIFGLHWGQWTKFDRGQPTLWVTRRPSKLPESAIVRELGGEQIPRGIVPPAGVETVYAVALDGGGGSDTPCDRCNPSGGGSSPYSMRSLDCVCALSPR